MTDVLALPHPLDDITANIRRNVKIVMAGGDVKATAVYRALGISRQTWSSRLHGDTRFSAAEVITIANILGVSVEMLAGPTSQLQAHHLWKKLTGPDLVVHPGGAKAAPSFSRPDQLKLRLLHSVPSME